MDVPGHEDRSRPLAAADPAGLHGWPGGFTKISFCSRLHNGAGARELNHGPGAGLPPRVTFDPAIGRVGGRDHGRTTNHPG